MARRYQLSFVSLNALVPDRIAFERYFARRPHYVVQNGRATYLNDETGVGFSFESVAPPPTISGQPRTWARFTLDFMRPSFFAEEATRELEPFVEQFGAPVRDASDASHVSYSASAFLKAWELGNREVCGAYRGDTATDPPTMVRSRLLSVWRWNYERSELQQSEGETVFVPRVWFVRVGNAVATAVIWPDATAIRAPQVDYVIFSRQPLEGAPNADGRPDLVVLPWATVSSSITGSVFFESPLVSWRIVSRPVLTGLSELVGSHPSATELPAIVPSEGILDREGFAFAMAAG